MSNQTHPLVVLCQGRFADCCCLSPQKLHLLHCWCRVPTSDKGVVGGTQSGASVSGVSSHGYRDTLCAQCRGCEWRNCQRAWIAQVTRMPTHTKYYSYEFFPFFLAMDSIIGYRPLFFFNSFFNLILFISVWVLLFIDDRNIQDISSFHSSFKNIYNNHNNINK